MSKPKQFDRDLVKLLKWPALSWSSMNAFESYDKEKWYKQYVLGERGEPNAAMLFGTKVGERLVAEPDFLPEVPRLAIFEQELRASFAGIQLMGHLDGFDPDKPALAEYKTSTNPNNWTQKKVDEWGQITFYCFLIYINYKIKPEDLEITLSAILAQETGHFELELSGVVNVFHTKRTMADLIEFGVRIKKTYQQMQEFVQLQEKLLAVE